MSIAVFWTLIFPLGILAWIAAGFAAAVFIGSVIAIGSTK